MRTATGTALVGGMIGRIFKRLDGERLVDIWIMVDCLVIDLDENGFCS